MKHLTAIAILLALAGCKTPGEAGPTAETTEQAQSSGEAEPAETTDDAEDEAAAAPAAFTPVKIPGTPHDEEGMSITLTWAGEPGEVGLMRSVGVPSKATARVTFAKGDEIAYEDTVVLVTEGRKLTLSGDDAKLTSASHFEPKTEALAEAMRDERVQKGDAVYLLKYAAEGTCYVQLNDDVYLSNCPADGFEKHERTPVASEWWVLVNGEGGSGWLKVDDRVEVDAKSTM